MFALGKAGAGFLFTVIVILQIWVVPDLINGVVQVMPEVSGLRDAGAVLLAILLLCGQLALVCVWRLLTRADHGRIFEDGAIRWVDAMIGCVAAAMLVVIVGCGILVGAGAGNRFVVWMTFLALILGVGVALLVGALREVLRNAVNLQDQVGAGG
ncbi:DUF2975 domain-containing protein [Microbacterium oleivorans]|uniref:DUF2975 domain-containing protein n=1 Tax=Microbacterium TaxID=33882 RepID=UPI00203CBB32|nr:DUF2975 domain-containing protein [Microbacterium oleivorans]MCM3694852.1 DUF2975 domain-containing protein [Microbacterium oleivorans]